MTKTDENTYFDGLQYMILGMLFNMYNFYNISHLQIPELQWV